MRLKRHVYPALMALALCVAIVVAWPAPAGSGRHARGAGQDLSERAPKKAAAAEPSRKTTQMTSRDVARAAALEASGKTTHQSPPELAPTAPSDKERRLPGGRILMAAAAGTGTGWVTMCLFVTVALLAARELRTKHTTRQEHQQWEMLAEEWRNGWHQGLPGATLPTSGPPRRIASRNSGSRITTREKVQW
jgi:hypothetical protein